MKIQAVTTSVNYSDYLSETIGYNKIHFDDFVVVTTKEDQQTQRLCKEEGVACVISTFGATFNKGRGINDGISSLENPEWIVLIDADIVLPTATRPILENINLNEQYIYGIDRMNCISKHEWDKYRSGTFIQHQDLVWINPGPWPISTRAMFFDCGGYVPMGFFQLFNINADVLHNRTFYDDRFTNAGGSDLTFSKRWPRTHRHLLPEIISTHLMTEDSYVGINWKGRRSKEFS